jgi:hypothetical protein
MRGIPAKKANEQIALYWKANSLNIWWIIILTDRILVLVRHYIIEMVDYL